MSQCSGLKVQVLESARRGLIIFLSFARPGRIEDVHATQPSLAAKKGDAVIGSVPGPSLPRA